MCRPHGIGGFYKVIGFYRKNKKKVVIIAILFLVVVAVAGGSIIYFDIREQTVPEKIYVEDYPKIYEEELRIIFGDDCEIGEKETFCEEGENCGCGWVDPTIQYDTWEVTYHDRMGETYTQTINNMYSLESLQYSWLESHLEQYYEKKYLIDYFDEGTFEGLTAYCRVSTGAGEFWCSMDKKEEYDRIMEGKRKYKEQLLESYKNRDTMLRLPELNCEEIYSHYPIITSFGLSVGDGELSGEEKEVYEKVA